MRELYLDANAHVPMSGATIKTYTDFQISRAGWGNPLAPSKPGQDAALALERARAKLSELLGAEAPNHIVITNTCTQACEWGLDLFQNYSKGHTSLYHSGMEHSAVYQKLTTDKFKNSFTLQKLNNNNSLVEPAKDDNGYVVCSYVQNEIGTIQPIEKLKTKYGLLFSDMCQVPGKLKFNLSKLPVDVAVFGAHKWGGPASVGLLYLKDFALYKEFGTGSRYFNDRPGTLDVAAVVAAAAALEETHMFMSIRLEKMQQFQKVLEDRLQDMGLKIIGKEVPRVVNTTFVHIPEIAFVMLSELSRKGIYVGMGSACGSMHSGPSLTMDTLGINGDAHDFLRISQHGEYGSSDAAYVADHISKLLKTYRGHKV